MLINQDNFKKEKASLFYDFTRVVERECSSKSDWHYFPETGESWRFFDCKENLYKFSVNAKEDIYRYEVYQRPKNYLYCFE